MKTVIVFLSTVSLMGCAAIEVVPGAEKILLTNQAAPKECQYIGEVSGSQGNVLTADITSDRNMIQGARNEIRNNAFKLGANYVVIENQSQSNNIYIGGTYNATIFGNAYKCPNAEAPQRG